MNKDEQNRGTATGPSASNGKRWLRAAGTVVTATAAVGLMGAGPASAHEEPVAPTGPLAAVNESVGSVVHHLDTYHLQDPTWELRSLLTDPSGNIEVHKQMIDGVLNPLVGLVP
ncbi:hypothetical protein ACPZ19_26295 [Amycolatopsis lurida]